MSSQGRGVNESYTPRPGALVPERQPRQVKMADKGNTPKKGQLELRKKQRKALGVYMRSLADMMMLRDWTIVMDWDSLPTEAEEEERQTVMEVYVAVIIKKMKISVDETAFIGLSPDEQRRICVHELVHAHLQPMSDMADETDKIIGGPAHYFFIKNFMRALEVATDDIATTIAPHMPPIDWNITRYETAL